MADKTVDTKTTDAKISKLDAAVAAAKARLAAKAAGGGASAKGAKVEKVKTSAAAKPSDEDRAAKKAQIEKDREERRAAKAAEREAKKAEKAAARAPAHMSKVLKAASKLPALNEAAQVTFGDITANFSRAQIAALALHLDFFNRVKATERALESKVVEGSTVTVVGGDPRYIGQTGTVIKAQRIRCYVEVEGLNKPLYLFTSDVEVSAEEAESASDETEEVEAEEAPEATGTEG